VWIPVRAKITVPFLLIAVAMAGVVAFILYQIVFENIDHRFNTQLVESDKLASEWMIQEENTRLATLRILAYTTGIGDALQAKDADALREAALGNTIGNQEDAVEFLDTQGNLVLSMRHRPGSLYVEDYVFSSMGSTNYRQWSFIEQVVAGRSDALGDKYSGLAHAPWGDYFYVSGPVYDSANQFAGVILVGEMMSNLVRKMRQDIGAQVTLYDLDGKPVVSTFASPELSTSDVTAVLEMQNSSSLRKDSSSRGLTFNTIRRDFRSLEAAQHPGSGPDRHRHPQEPCRTDQYGNSNSARRPGWPGAIPRLDHRRNHRRPDYPPAPGTGESFQRSSPWKFECGSEASIQR
jgi:hypothetical protein